MKVEGDEITKIAAFLGMEEHKFIQEFTRIRANRSGLALSDKESSTECIMLEGGECRIHEVKPVQCRGFPNVWNFPGWEKECEAVAVPLRGEA